MPGGQALIAEVAVDLEHPLEAADGEPLEEQFRGHAQIERQVQGIVMGDEGFRVGAAGDDVHHRRLHFEKVPLDEKRPQILHDPRAHGEGPAHGLVHDEIQVALAVAGLGVAQAVELLRQGPQALVQQHGFLGR